MAKNTKKTAAVAKKSPAKKKRAPKPTATKKVTVAARRKAVPNKKGRQARMRISAEHALNQAELGERLNPPRARSLIESLMKRPGCPGRTANGGGQYHVAAWQAWIEQTGIGDRDTTLSATTARARKIEIENELSEMKLEEARGNTVSLDEALPILTTAITDFWRQLGAMEDTIASELAGATPGQIKKRIREEKRRVASEFAEGGWCPQKKKFWKTLSAKVSGHLSALVLGSGASDG